MWRSPQTDDTHILVFLEENQDMVDRNLDLASVKAWTLFHVGRLKEAEALKIVLVITDSVDLARHRSSSHKPVNSPANYRRSACR